MKLHRVIRLARFIILLLSLFVYHRSNMSLGQKVNWESFDWRVLKTDHFNIHYPKGYESIGKITAIYAEEANILISEKLRHTLLQVIPIFVYPSHGHFQHTNIIPFTLDEGVGGFTEPIKRRVVVPFLGSYDEYRHVLTHELVHAFQYDILYGTSVPFTVFGPPLWVIEGMAEYLSIGWEETGELFARDAIYTDTLPSLEELTAQRVPSGYSIYKGGQSVMFFIEDVYGEHKIAELMQDIRDHSSLRNAVYSTFRLSLKEFSRKWTIWLKRKYADVAHKKTLEEEALMVTRHREDGSFLNFRPSISPDGQHLAYLTIRNFLPAIVLKETGAYKKRSAHERDDPEIKSSFDRKEELLIQGGDNHEFHQLHLLDNRISFSSDSKKIFFCAKSGGKDYLYLFDIHKKKVIRRWSPALDVIQAPQLSSDGKKAVMVGVVLGQPDVYSLDLKTNVLTQLTFDLFAEKDPVLSGDNEHLLFSSNRNEEANFEETNYHIFEMSLKRREVKQITFGRGKQSSPQYYYKNKNHRIFYTSTQNGTPNLFLKDKNDESEYQITDLVSGVFHPTIDRDAERIVFGAFFQQGYDISIMQAPQNPQDVQAVPQARLSLKTRQYPVYTKGLSNFRSEPYRSRFSVERIFLTLFYDNVNRISGAAYGSVSDYLGDHQFSGYFDYLTGITGFNVYVDYGYLKHRTDFYVGLFRESSIFSLYRLASSFEQINNLIAGLYRLTESYRNLGFHFTAVHPLTSFWSVVARFVYSRYEETFNSRRPNIFTNLNQISVGFAYNDVLQTPFGPIQGQYFRYSISQSANLSGNDFVFNQQELEYRTYYNFFVRYVFAFKAFLGAAIGPESRFFPSFIGGYNLRGYPVLAFEGTKVALASLEFRLPILDALLLGFPVPWVLPGFSGVLFIDAATVFYEFEQFRGFDPEAGRLDDIKLTIGLGIRVLIFPGVFLKFDWGVPWDFKTVSPLSKSRALFGIGANF